VTGREHRSGVGESLHGERDRTVMGRLGIVKATSPIISSSIPTSSSISSSSPIATSSPVTQRGSKYFQQLGSLVAVRSITASKYESDVFFIATTKHIMEDREYEAEFSTGFPDSIASIIARRTSIRLDGAAYIRHVLLAVSSPRSNPLLRQQ